jgi:hypothetical protein
VRTVHPRVSSNSVRRSMSRATASGIDGFSVSNKSNSDEFKAGFHLGLSRRAVALSTAALQWIYRSSGCAGG